MAAGAVTRLFRLASLLGALLLAGGCDDTGASQPLSATIGAGDIQTTLDESGGIVLEELAFPATDPVPATALKVPVLMYHHVGESPAGADEIRLGLTVSTADFAAQMDYLKQADYHPISMEQLFGALYYEEPLPDKPVLLTLDDGYLDNYTEAAPVLERLGFPATFYIITGKVGEPEYMNWEQVTDLDRRGMDIGSHTVSHPDLTSQPAESLALEVGESGDALASQLGHPVYWFCYPAGRHDATVAQALKEAGYLLATTTEPGETQSSDAPFALPRYRVRPDTGVEGVAELVR